MSPVVASFGALHSMNLFLKRPDLTNGVIAAGDVILICGSIPKATTTINFNSPSHYVPNLSDEWYLNNIRQSRHIHILSGRNYEDPQASGNFRRF
jgi:esterase/lipase superfamily enzyme